MGMELRKQITVFAMLCISFLAIGCMDSNTQNTQKQEQVVVNTSASPSGNVEESGIESSPSSEENNGSSDIQTSPTNKDNADSKENGMPSPNQNDKKNASQSGSSADNINSPEQTTVDENEKKSEAFFNDKILWSFIGVLVTLTLGLGCKYFRKNQKRRKFDDSKEEQVDFSLRPQFRVDNLHDIGQREEQQDSFCISDVNDTLAVKRKGIMAVVADGMGGLEGGAAISQLVADTFLREYKRRKNINDASDFLYNTAKAAETAAEKYMEQANVDGGSTLIAVLIQENKMHFISVGDSHIYRLTERCLTLINKEHNFAAVLKEKAARGEVAQDEPYVNPRRNSLTAYIGMGSFQIMDANEEPLLLNSGDKIFLCSDGVFNTLDENELEMMLADDVVTAKKRIKETLINSDVVC